MSNRVVYSIIVPLYNEELVIDESYRRLKKVMDSVKEDYEIILVNDGSKDKTREKAEKNRYVRGLVSWIGYKQTYVEFERQARLAGETKYS